MSKLKTIGFVDCKVRYDGDEFISKLLTDAYNVKKIDFDLSKCRLSSDGFFPKSQDYHQKVLEEINSCDIIVGFAITCAAFVEEMKISWFHSISAGVHHLIQRVDPDKAQPTYLLTRTGGMYGSYMSEYVIGQIIASERKFEKYYELQKAHEWPLYSMGSSPRLLSSLSIAILGAGDIGCVIAKHCKTFGMKVYGMVSVLPQQGSLYIDKYFTSTELSTYLQLCDFICCVLPKTNSTNNILSNGILKHCASRKPVLINIGRGNVIREDDIIVAIGNKWIKGAVLDILNTEPLPASSKLWDVDGVTITPHVSGVIHINELVDVFSQNLKLFEKGEQMKYLVNWSKGY